MVGVAGFEPAVSASRTRWIDQLSHTPMKLEPSPRVELGTFSIPRKRSAKLSYDGDEFLKNWSRPGASNSAPSEYESDALPNELGRLGTGRSAGRIACVIEDIYSALQTHPAWVALVIPGLLSAVTLARTRAVSLTGLMLIAVMAGLAISWTTRRWDASGLRILPAAMVIIAAMSIPEFTDGTWQRAARRGAVIAAWVWVSTLIVDVLGCFVEHDCHIRDTGAAGLLDGLVIGPVAGLVLALLLWCALGWPKRRAEIESNRQPG